MSALPITLRSEPFSGTTAATANTETTVDVLTAPPAGTRYRVWWVSLGGASQTASPVVGRFKSTFLASDIAVCSTAPGAGAQTVVWPEGVTLGKQAGLQLVVSSPGTNQPFIGAVGYTIEPA